MRSIIYFLFIFILTISLLPAQSISHQAIGAITGEIQEGNGPTLIHGIGAVGSTHIKNDISIDQGMFLACDLPCDPNTIKNIENAIYQQALISSYPNPTNGPIYFEGLAHLIFRYELYNSTGQLLRHVPIQGSRINISEYPSGLYLLKVYGRNNDLSLIMKVTKE